MIIQCPNCGEKLKVKGLGRKPLNIPLKNICEALQTCRSVELAAQQLGCSQGYIFKVLKANNLKLKEIIKSQIKSTVIFSKS
jgi:hypothetical protein